MAEVGKSLPALELDGSYQARDWFYLVLLLALVLPLRAYLLYHTEVTARDSIGYIRYALQFEKYSWQEVLLKNHQHPGYPLAIWAVSQPVRALLGPANPDNMQLSAQLASSLAAILLLFPMYFLGRFYYGSRTAFWGCLLFQYLPVSGHHLSDGISEAWFLLLTSSAYVCILQAMRKQQATYFALGGLFCGLAYLTRPEGAMVLASAVLVLWGCQVVPGWRKSWQSTLRHSLVLTLSGLAVGSLYFGFTHKFTNKPSIKQIMNPNMEPGSQRRQAQGFPQSEEPRLMVPLASVFAASYQKNGSLTERLGQGIVILSVELVQLFHYLGLLAVGLGMLWHLPRLGRVPEFLVPMVFVALHGLLILALACSAGYLSDRHLMVIAVWWAFFGAAGLLDLPGKVVSYWPQAKQVFASQTWLLSAFSLALLLGFLGMCLPRTLQTVHGNRVGNRAAGLWLAQRWAKGDIILDDHGWSHYYSGLFFMEGENVVLHPQAQPTCYVVMTRSLDEEVGRKRQKTEDFIKASQGQIVYHWPEHTTDDKARIAVYAMPRSYAKHPWKKGPVN
jgi:hypothetical protein